MKNYNNYTLRKSGISEIFYGPMNSGKSKELVRKAEYLREHNLPFLAFKPTQDTRDGAFVKTRDPKFRSVEAISINSADEILEFVSLAKHGFHTLLKSINQHQYLCDPHPEVISMNKAIEPLINGLYAVIADEIFLLDSRIIAVTEQLVHQGIHVYAGGLDRDFRREFFPLKDFDSSEITMKSVISSYQERSPLSAACKVCEGEAMYSQRLVNGEPAHYTSPTILIGDEEYEARCEQHHCVTGHPQGAYALAEATP